MSLTAFLHRKVEPDALCLYRASLGALIAAEAASWLPYSTERFSSDGFHIPLWSWVRFSLSPAMALAACAALIGAAVLMVLGLFTRAAIAATLVLWTSLSVMDRISERAVWSIVTVVLALLLFSPCGEAYSLDRLWRGRAGSRQPIAFWPQLFLRVQFAQVYFFSGWVKLTHADWVNGSILSRICRSRWATDVGLSLGGLDMQRLARVAGLGTIVFEMLAGLLLLIPGTRRLFISLAILFHLGIQATLHVGSLGAHFIAALLFLFPDPRTVASTARVVGARAWTFGSVVALRVREGWRDAPLRE